MKNQRTHKVWIILAVFLTMALLTPTAFAQQKQDAETGWERGMRGHGKMHDGMKSQRKMMKELMPPRMLLKHGDAIGLTDAQRTQITKIIEDSRKNTDKLQAELQAESDKLTPLLAAAKPDTNATLHQADRVFAAETKLKRARLESMLRTKSILTPDQVTKIDQFRKNHGKNMDGKHHKNHKHGKNHKGSAQ